MSDGEFNPPLENAGGSRLFLAENVASQQGPATSESQFVLWSGCNGSCTDCAAGTGKLWVFGQFPSCTEMAPGGAFGLFYSGGLQGAQEMCSPFLYEFDAFLFFSICAILVICMVLFAFLVLVAALCRQGRMWRRLQNSHATTECVIGMSAIEKHFPMSYSNKGDLCTVCLLDIEGHEQVRRLQCGHEFHAGCIADWWTHRPRTALECPLCRCKQRLGEGDAKDVGGQTQTASSSIAASASPNAATADLDRNHGSLTEVEEI